MRTQVTSQREEVKYLIIQQQKTIQSQVSEMVVGLKMNFSRISVRLQRQHALHLALNLM